jgi:hypothetical protein
MREQLALKRAQQVAGPGGAPRNLQPLRNERFFTLLSCPSCKMKGLPLHNDPTAVAWSSRCLKCGGVFVFHEKGVDVPTAIAATGERSPVPGIKWKGPDAKNHGTQGPAWVDANKFAESDLERRQAGRNANSLGLILTRST